MIAPRRNARGCIPQGLVEAQSHPLLEMSMIRTFAAAAAALCLLPAPAAFAQTTQAIVTVVKVSGLPWFNRMEEGVKAFGASTPGTSTRQTGPARAEAAAQVALLQSLLGPEKIDALAIVPTDPRAIEDVARRAMKRGTVVVTHEADNLRHTHANIEAFDNAAFGAALNAGMASCMGHTGRWTSFVGSRRSRTHQQWAEGGAANARQHPGMVLVAPLTESRDDADTAYVRARALLRKYPDLRGFQGAASSDGIGIGRAVEEAGLQGKVCVFGTGLPSRTQQLLESGAVQGIGFWDPKDAGLAMNRVARLLLDKQPITDGMDLGVPGYQQVKVSRGVGGGWLIVGQAGVIVDKTSYKNYPF
jgi:simple sugar transport system substrate-binding protein